MANPDDFTSWRPSHSHSQSWHICESTHGEDGLLDKNRVLREGWLQKEDPHGFISKHWRQRYFKLTETGLTYAKSPADAVLREVKLVKMHDLRVHLRARACLHAWSQVYTAASRHIYQGYPWHSYNFTQVCLSLIKEVRAVSGNDKRFSVATTWFTVCESESTHLVARCRPRSSAVASGQYPEPTIIARHRRMASHAYTSCRLSPGRRRPNGSPQLREP
jgi:hypothetical protein